MINRRIMINKKKLILVVGVIMLVIVCSITISTFREYLCLIKQAHRNEYIERKAIWNVSRLLTAKDMLSNMTMVANGDSVLVCKVSGIPLNEYSDFVKDKAQPTRYAWVRIREAYMESLVNGVDWMERKSMSMPFTSYVIWSQRRFDEQGRSRKSFRQSMTSREKELNALYPRNIDSEEAYDNWVNKYKSLFTFTHNTGKWILAFNDSYFNENSLATKNHGIVFPF